MDSMPFVRCVGIGVGVYQNERKKAYDWRLICVLEGEGSLELEEKTLHTGPNQLYMIQPGVDYRVCSPETQKIAVINFDTTCAHCHIADPVLSVDAAAFQEDRILRSGPIPFLSGSVYAVSPGDLALFEELYQLYLRDGMDREMKRFLLGARLAYILSRVLDHVKMPDRLSAAIYQYILDNACEKLHVEAVAGRFNYSQSYVEKLLRRDYNTSFRQLVIDTRLKKALWLLENTSDSCEQIALRLGFCSSQHFTQTFKKRYGRTPGQCR